MGDEHDAKDEHDELAGLDASDPSSGARAKRQLPPDIARFVADLRRRTAGLSGAELDAAFDRAMDDFVDEAAALVPVSVREKFKARLRQVMQHDPAFADLLGKLRARTQAHHQ